MLVKNFPEKYKSLVGRGGNSKAETSIGRHWLGSLFNHMLSPADLMFHLNSWLPSCLREPSHWGFGCCCCLWKTSAALSSNHDQHASLLLMSTPQTHMEVRLGLPLLKETLPWKKSNSHIKIRRTTSWLQKPEPDLK